MSARRARGAAWALVGLVAIFLPAITGNNSYTLLKIDYVLALVIVCCGAGITMGFAGQYFIAPSGVLLVSAMTSSYAALHVSALANLPMMLVLGVVSGVAFGVVIGLPALRLAGFYFGMLTLYVAVVVPVLSDNLGFTGGLAGLNLIGGPASLSSPSGEALYGIGAALVVVCGLLSWRMWRTRLGRRLNTIRESEALSASIGIDVYRTKMLAFTIGSAVMGAGAAYFAFSQQFINGSAAESNLSILILAAIIVGGLGTPLGFIVGGVLVFGLSEFLTSFAEYQDVVFGIVVILVMILFPDGLRRVPFRSQFGVLVKRLRLVKAGGGEEELASRLSVRPVGGGGVGDAPRVGVLGWGLVEEPAGLPEEALVGDGLSVSFGGVRALDGVDITIMPGTVHGVIGSNGSGKTTLINALSGFVRLGSGAIRIGCGSVARQPTRLARAGIVRTFQTPKVLEDRTVLENVLIGVERTTGSSGLSDILGLPKARTADALASSVAHSLLRATRLEVLEGQQVSEIDFGRRRLVELARVLALRPRFLLLDEPAAGLSPIEIDVLSALVRQACAAGVGVLFVEHNIPLALELSTEMTGLHLGRVIASGKPSEVVECPEVRDAFLGQEFRGAPRLTGSARSETDIGPRGARCAQPAGAAEHVLSVANMSAGYGSMSVVSDVSLQVRSGEIVALLGRNGAGKTTAVSAIAGLRYGSNVGTVRADGADLSRAEPWEVSAAGVCLVPEGRHVFRRMSVMDNLRVAAQVVSDRGARERGSRRAAFQRQLEEVCELFPVLSESLTKTAGLLSGGQQQMVAIADALMASPVFLLIDEPMLGLAPIVVEEIAVALRKLAANGTGILLVEENVERALTVADAGVVMDQGRIVRTGSTAVLAADPEVERIVRGVGSHPTSHSA